MFGRRSQEPSAPNRVLPAHESAPMAVVKSTDARPMPIEARVPPKPEPVAAERRHSEEYYDVKTTVFNALIDTVIHRRFRVEHYRDEAACWPTSPHAARYARAARLVSKVRMPRPLRRTLFRRPSRPRTSTMPMQESLTGCELRPTHSPTAYTPQ